MRNAFVESVEYHLPAGKLSNEDLAREFPDWSVQKISDKTGIDIRHIAGSEECASDLAVTAASKLIERKRYDKAAIDFVLFCTQSPDYFLPTTACLIQDRLGLPTSAGALDFNLGCSGYVYGLGLAKGLIESGQAKRVLLLTGETYSKFVDKSDRSVRTIFGDGASASLVTFAESGEDERPFLGPFVYGTDGRGAENLIVEVGGLRNPLWPGAQGDVPGRPTLAMDGGEVFAFTLSAVPAALALLLERAGIAPDDVDLFIFHQANRHMLGHLQKKCRIPKEKFFVQLADCGNTVSATIPIALREAELAGRLHAGARVALVGFGVGYSWAAALCTWRPVETR